MYFQNYCMSNNVQHFLAKKQKKMEIKMYHINDCIKSIININYFTHLLLNFEI